MLMSLGMFVFEISTAAFQELDRRMAWRFAETSRVGARPARQFVGPGQGKITLQGLIAPEVTGDLQSLRDLEAMGDEGAAWPLVSGYGRVYGAFEIEELSERQTHHFADGAPRRVEFSLTLSQVEDADALAAGVVLP